MPCSEPLLYFPMGTTGIEFCNYDTSECPFGEEYCMCKDLEIDINYNKSDKKF